MKIFGHRKETVEIPGFGMGAGKKKKKGGETLNFSLFFSVLKKENHSPEINEIR